jgi:hypothetical protein
MAQRWWLRRHSALQKRLYASQNETARHSAWLQTAACAMPRQVSLQWNRWKRGCMYLLGRLAASGRLLPLPRDSYGSIALYRSYTISIVTLLRQAPSATCTQNYSIQINHLGLELHPLHPLHSFILVLISTPRAPYLWMPSAEEAWPSPRGSEA